MRALRRLKLPIVRQGLDHHGAGGNLRGILAMILGTAGFVTNDMFVKLASETLPTSQIIFLRGLATTLIILTLAIAISALDKFVQVLIPAVGWRTFSEVSATVLYLTALFHMPFANATAIIQAMPFIFTLVAALYFGERVGWRRWLAVGTGFIGILMIIQPGGAGFNVYALLAVAALAFTVSRDLSTRYIPIVVPAVLVALMTSVAVTVTGGMWGFAEHWVVLTTREYVLLAAAAVTMSIGYYFLIDGVRFGEISAIAPFRYTYLVWALLYGILIWGEIPDPLAFAGIALIVGSGLVVYYRERLSAHVTKDVGDGSP